MSSLHDSVPPPPASGRGRPPAPQDRLIGRTLEDRYRVDAKLARGGMSTVYRGVDLRLDRPVAIKVMAPAYAADPTFLTRFEREARAAAKLDNPHVVGVYDQGRDGDDVFLVMELVVGGTLRDLIHERGALSVPVSLAILEPVLDALRAAHEAGLVHRDVKPENVLISHQGDVKVADFGLVRALASTTMATGNVILGTVAYLSPEQVDTGASDERSDVYSAGIVGFEMLTGAPPFGGDNPMSVAYQHVHGDVPSVATAAPGVPVAIAAAIDSATRRDATQRPTNAGQFLNELQAARTSVGVPVATVPPPTTALQAAQRISDSATSQRPTMRATRRAPVTPSANPQTTARRAARAHAAQRRWRRRLIVLITIAALALAATLGGWWLAEQWTSMPAVTSLSQTAAVSAVESAGLVAALTTTYHNAIPSNAVISSDPTEDTRQKRGETVTLVISAGQPSVPELTTGMSIPTASADLRRVGLEPVLDTSVDEYDNSVAEGMLLRTDPAAGKTVPLGTEVTLIVSRGATPTAIPDVANKLVEDAENKLLVDGFQVGVQRTAFSAEVSPGTVIGTEPAAGMTAPHGSEVSLVLAVSKVVPQLSVTTISDAAEELRADGFDVRIGTTVFDDEVPGGGLVDLDPPAGTRLDPASPTVTLIGSNAVTVPLVAGMSVSTAKAILAGESLTERVRSLFGGDSSTVISQQPEAGVLVAPGSSVELQAWP